MSAEPLLCGIDAGTSRMRAVVVDLAGNVVAAAAEPTPTRRLGPGRAEHDAEALWATLVRVLRVALAEINEPRRVRGLAVASMGEAGVLLDADGRALAPLLAWFDNRPAGVLDELLRGIGLEALHRLTGLSPDPTFSLLKLLWLERQWPGILGRARAWLHVSDYLAWRLCGRMATDTSLAARTMALDLAGLRWATDLLAEVGVPARLMQPLAPSGRRLGTLTAAAAAATGLDRGAVVGVAGHDHVGGMLAVGADRPGVLMDSMGTAEALTLTLAAPGQDPMLGREGINQGVVQVEAPVFYAFAGLPTSGGSVEWFRANQPDAPDHATLIAEADAVPPGSRGTLFLPHLRIGSPPWPDPIARGAFLGLSDTTTRGQMFRAVLEGMALDAAHVLAVVLRRLGVPTPGRIVVIGGSTRNDLLLRIKASLLEQPLQVAGTAEAVGLGAAMLGGLAAGIFPDLAAARAAMGPRFRAVVPDLDWQAEERARRLAAYAKAYATLRELHSLLRD
jgi:xylulokinase